MLTELLKQIRENPDKYKEGIKKKKSDISIDQILDLDKDWREINPELENLRAEQNQISKEKDFSPERIKKAKSIKIKIKELEEKIGPVEKELGALLYKIPNLPDPEMPIGDDEDDNVVIKQVGEKTNFDFEPKDYLEIAEKLDWIDVKRAAKVSGSRFGYLKRGAVRIEFALVQYVFDVLTDEKILKEIADGIEDGYNPKPFIEIVPPVMIKEDVYKRTGRLSEESKDDTYQLTKDDLWLVASAEHTLVPFYMDEILDEKDLPIRYIGFSTAFRREAGSYGKDTKGILRVHQFDKLEMETFSLPENSRKEQRFLVAIQEYLVSSLGIPYQVVDVCTGDTGNPDARQFDIECWMPSQNKYRETHTADFNSDYQTMRLNTRVKRVDGKKEFVHANDATAFAIGRTLIAIIENYQQKDGSVKIPEVLKKYM